MPKPSAASMHPDAAVESSGVLAGKFEVLDSKFRVHQANQREGQEARGPVIALVLKVTPISDEGERLEDADTRDIILGLGSKSVQTFHPGKGSSPEDDDPEDLGTEPGTEGNTLYISGGSVEMNSASSYTVFTKSLKHRGFSAEKIASCWAPSYVGLKLELTTVTPDKLEAYGQKKRDVDPKVPFSYKVVQDVIAQPGEKKKKGADAPAPAKKAAPKTTAPAPAAADDDDAADATDVASAGGNEAETEARRVLTIAAGKLAGKNKKIDQAKVFWVTLYSDPKVKGSAKLQQEARKYVNNEAWLINELEELDCVVDADERTVQFAEAA